MPDIRSNESPWPYFAAGLGAVLLASFFLWQVFHDPVPLPSAIDERAAGPAFASRRPAAAPAAAAPPPSSLAFTGSAEDLAFAPQAAPADPERKLRQAVAESENKARALAIAYTKRHPSIANYGRDWMSYPDLKKLNDDYMRERDPIKFMKGLAKSESFPKLVQKYAADPAVHSFVMEAIKQAPSGLAASVAGYLPGDGAVKELVGVVTEAIGLPKSMTAGLLGEKGAKAPDEKELLQQVLSSPQLRKAAAQPAPAKSQ